MTDFERQVIAALEKIIRLLRGIENSLNEPAILRERSEGPGNTERRIRG